MSPSRRFPALLPVSLALHRTRRRLTWLRSRRTQARRDASVATPFVVTRHRSVLMRRLAGVDQELQRNKVHNLGLAAAALDGRVLGPGDTLSFWRCVGNPSTRHGYRPGLVLTGDGDLDAGVGGGLCQLANLLHWMALHTPLEVIERHHHDHDVFPDSGRVLPFGTGAGVFYNHVDLRLRNPTPDTYRLRVWLTDEELCGQVLASALPPLAYHVEETGHRFVRRAGTVRRQNTIWRRCVDRRTGRTVALERLEDHDVPVLYEVDSRLVEVEPAASR